MAINMPQGQRREKEILLLLNVAQIAPTLRFGHIPGFFSQQLLSGNDDFDFNQDNSINFDEEYRSPGWDRYKKNKMLKWKK